MEGSGGTRLGVGSAWYGGASWDSSEGQNLRGVGGEQCWSLHWAPGPLGHSPECACYADPHHPGRLFPTKRSQLANPGLPPAQASPGSVQGAESTGWCVARLPVPQGIGTHSCPPPPGTLCLRSRRTRSQTAGGGRKEDRSSSSTPCLAWPSRTGAAGTC